MNDARLKQEKLNASLSQEIKKRKWKAYSKGEVSFQVEESLFNEMLTQLHDFPLNAAVVILLDESHDQLFRMFARVVEAEVSPRLQEFHSHGMAIAMQEAHIVQPLRMTIHYLSDGQMVYVTRKEMLPYS